MQSVGVCMSMCLPASLYCNGSRCSCGDNAFIVPAHYSRLCAQRDENRGRERERSSLLACLSATPGLMLPPPTFIPFSHTLLLLCPSSLTVSMRTESVGYGVVVMLVVCVTCPQSAVCVYVHS